MGGILARLRHDQGLTGHQLAEKAGISQGQISKIENSKTLPSPEDVRRISTALHASPKVVETLVDEAKQQQQLARTKGTRRPALGRTGTINQQEVLDEEGKAQHVRDFQPVLLPGLLQTSEYTRRVLNGYNELTYGEDSKGWPDTAAAVTLRAQRQQRLYDTTRHFEFVIMEAVFHNRFAAVEWPGFMVGQLQRIKAAAGLQNVSIRILPLDTVLRYPPISGFTIMDESTVVNETTAGTVDRDRGRVSLYIRVFEQLMELGTDDLDPILNRHLSRFATELAEQAAEAVRTGP
ncbi:hypothetical protein BCD49_28180 [Pseudofrankia sp. EUN1h]|nr:hypothetical protein BCD49_28180 [Pseudofrankia sp. EUN1h]